MHFAAAVRGFVWVCLSTMTAITAPRALAWGPHSEITAAALDVLGTNDVLAVRLGPGVRQLTNTCWMPDYFGVIFEEREAAFYADDYLLFRGASTYFEHIGPKIRGAFRPFYHRALQAMRTEDSANAARWVGALIHFIQDAGCPPHAAGLRGDVHSNMENWIHVPDIHIPGYRPEPMGTSDDVVFDALMRRIDEASARALDQGRRLRVDVEIGNQGAVRPVALEAALASAQLTADLLRSLGKLPEAPAAHSAGLSGKITSTGVPGMERFPARVQLLGTPYATMAGMDGQFAFHHLPAGDYQVMALRPGSGVATQAVHLVTAKTVECALTLPPGERNLVLNGDFKLRTLAASGPDYWTSIRGGWEGLPIPLKPGQKYRLTARFKPGVQGTVLVRYTRPFEHALPRFKIEPKFRMLQLNPEKNEIQLEGSPTCGIVHLTLRGSGSPWTVFESVILRAE